MSSEQENTALNGNQDFGLPEGYFQQSAKAVMDKIAWLEEHRDFPVLTALQAKNGFKIPGGYFAACERRFELLDCPVLSSLQKTEVFTTPPNYFEASEIEALSKVIEESENTLGFIPKENNFKLSADYFSENKKQIESLLLKDRKPSRTIVLFGAKVWIAAAAVLIVALGFWLYNFYVAQAGVKDCGTMACIDKVDLLKTRNLENLENDELYELVNSKKLEQKLEEKSPVNKKDKKADSLDDNAADYLLDGI